MNIDCNQISCKKDCEPLSSDCVILSGECQELCYVNFCDSDIPNLTKFIEKLCLDFLDLKNNLNCLKEFCNPTCTIISSPITVSI